MKDSTALPFVLKALRRAAGMDVEEMALLAGISPAALRHIERGFRVPKWPTVCALADVLGVGCDAFREGPNQRPVETGYYRDARLAALGRWHSEEATRRRLAEAARGVRLTADQISGQADLDTAGPGFVIIPAVEAPQLDSTEVASSMPWPMPDQAELDGAKGSDQGGELADRQGQGGELADRQGQGGELADDVFEPAVVLDGERLRRVLQYQAELGRLDRGDKRALTQARRRAQKRGADQVDVDLAGYAAVVRHRELTREQGKPSHRIAQDRRSGSRGAPGPPEKAVPGKRRKRAGQD